MAQLMSLPLTISCFSKIQIGFTFLGSHPGSPVKRAVKRMCVCVCACVLRPGKTQAGTQDTGPEIRNIPGNTGRLATLVTVRGTV